MTPPLRIIMIHNVTTMSHNSIAIQDSPNDDNDNNYYFDDYYLMTPALRIIMIITEFHNVNYVT